MRRATLWAAIWTTLMVMNGGLALAQGAAPPIDATLEQAYELYDAGEFEAALKLFERAGEAGSEDGQYMAGLMYHRGRGTEVNGPAAVTWYKRAAATNSPAALTNLGVIYRDGVGVEPDIDQAMNYLRRAAYLGDSFGQLAYAAYTINNAQNQAEFVEGVAFMRLAADGGNEIAQDNLTTLRVSAEDSELADAKREELEQLIARFQGMREAQQREREQGEADPAPREPAPGNPAAASPASDRPAANGERPEQMVFQQVTLNDAKWRGNPSHTVLVPEGWQVEGGAFWYPPQLYATMPSIDLKVTGPAGQQVHVMPSAMATDKSYPPGLNMPQPQLGQPIDGYQYVPMPRSPDDWARFVKDLAVPAHRPGSSDIRVVEQASDPTMTALLRQQLQPLAQQAAVTNQRNAASGMNTQQSVDTYFLTFDVRYAQDGKTWREMMGFGVGYIRTVSNAGFGPNESIGWWIEPALSFRAPVDVPIESHMPVMMAVANSVQMTPQWHQMREELRRKAIGTNHNISRDRIETSRRISQITAQTNREINDMRQRSNDARTASQDRGQREFVEYIREVETWNTTDGSSVQLPGGYQNAFSNGRGGFIVTNGGSAPAGWTQLQRTP